MFVFSPIVRDHFAEICDFGKTNSYPNSLQGKHHIHDLLFMANGALLTQRPDRTFLTFFARARKTAGSGTRRRLQKSMWCASRVWLLARHFLSSFCSQRRSCTSFRPSSTPLRRRICNCTLCLVRTLGSYILLKVYNICSWR